MSRLALWFICFLAVLFSPLSLLRAQNFPAFPFQDFIYRLDSGSSRLYPNGFALEFEKLISLYTWDAAVRASTRPAREEGNMSGSVDVAAVGRLRLRDEVNSVTREGQLRVLGELPLLKNDVTGFARCQANTYGLGSITNSRIGLLRPDRDLVNSLALIGAVISLDPNVRFMPAIGYSQETQNAQKLSGLVARGDLIAQPFALNENNYFEGGLMLDERFHQGEDHARNDRFRLALSTDIEGAGSNMFRAEGGFVERNIYFGAFDTTGSIPVQRRRESSVILSDRLDYPLFAERLQSVLRVEFEPRSISRITRSFDVGSLGRSTGFFTLLAPSDVDGLRIAAEGQFNYVPQSLPVSARFGLRYEEKNETVSLITSEFPNSDAALTKRVADALQEASFQSKITEAMLVGLFRTSRNSLLTAEIASRIFNYDPLSAQNRDTRDDLTSSGRLSFVGRISEPLSYSLNLSGARTHLVYLRKERSAQNATTNSVNFSVGLDHRATSFSQQLRGEVFANYTVLDYLDLLPSLASSGSYLIRGFQVYDSLAVSLSRDLYSEKLSSSIEGIFELHVNERGTYNESRFSSRPQTEQIAFDGQVAYVLKRTSHAAFRLRLGAKLFLLDQYGIPLDAQLQSSLFRLEAQRRVGPMINVEVGDIYANGPKLDVFVWYWSNTTKQRDRPELLQNDVEARLSSRWFF